MTEEEFNSTIQEEAIQAIYLAYEKGYSAACQNIIDAIGLLPVPTINKEHLVKLIGIIQRASKDKMNAKL